MPAANTPRVERNARLATGSTAKLMAYLKKVDFPAMEAATAKLYEGFGKDDKANPLKAHSGIYKPYDDFIKFAANSSVRKKKTLNMALIEYMKLFFKPTSKPLPFYKLLLQYVTAYNNPQSDTVINSVTKIRAVMDKALGASIDGYAKGHKAREQLHKAFNAQAKWVDRNDKYVETRDANREKQMDVLDTDIYKVIQNWRAMLIDGTMDFENATLLVELCTGVRSNEVMNPKMTQFTPSQFDQRSNIRTANEGRSEPPDLEEIKEGESRGPDYVKIKGVSKKSALYEAGSDTAPVVNNPVLILTIDELLAAVEIVREFITNWRKTSKNADLENRNVYTNTFNKGLNKLCEKLLGKGITTHLLREIYANLSYNLYAPPGFDKSRWITKVLRHENATAALSYQTVHIKTDKIGNSSNENLIKMLNQVKAEADATEQRIIAVGDNVEQLADDMANINIADVVPVKLNGRQRDGEPGKFRRLDIHARALTAEGKKLTYENLRTIGIGTTVIRRWKMRRA